MSAITNNGLLFNLNKIIEAADPKNYVNCWASYGDIETYYAYPAVANPKHRWNGWARPKFTLEVLLMIMEDQKMTLVHEDLLAKQRIYCYEGGGIEEGVLASGDESNLWEIDSSAWNISNDKGQILYKDGSVGEEKDVAQDTSANLVLKQIERFKKRQRLGVARSLWDSLGEVPTNNSGEIEAPWENFSAGTNSVKIWIWFEDTFDVSVTKDLMRL